MDISTAECRQLNHNLFEKVLSKEFVLKLDEDGELLYSKIESLIKGTEEKNGELKISWVCAIKKKYIEAL